MPAAVRDGTCRSRRCKWRHGGGQSVPRGWLARARSRRTWPHGSERTCPRPGVPGAHLPASPVSPERTCPRPRRPWATRATAERMTADAGREEQARLAGSRVGLRGAGPGEEDARLAPPTLLSPAEEGPARPRLLGGLGPARLPEEPSAGAPPASLLQPRPSTPGSPRADGKLTPTARDLGVKVCVPAAAPSLRALGRWPGALQTRLCRASSSHCASPPGDTGARP